MHTESRKLSGATAILRLDRILQATYIYVPLFDWIKRDEGFLLDRGQPNIIDCHTM